MAPPMKPLKTCSHRALGGKEPKIVASLGFTSFYMTFSEAYFKKKLYVKLFYQTIYQNSYSSTHRAVHGAKTPKKGFMDEVEPCQTGPNFIAKSNNIYDIK